MRGMLVILLVISNNWAGESFASDWFSFIYHNFGNATL
jgi:hypothetical protein